jgi:hypothetical protein
MTKILLDEKLNTAASGAASATSYAQINPQDSNRMQKHMLRHRRCSTRP